MKVKIRTGFVVSYIERSLQKQLDGNKKIVEREYNFYPEDGEIDLEDARVREHAHKLEPADKDAKALLSSMRVDTRAGFVGAEDPEAVAKRAADDRAAIAAAASQATIEALVKAGVIKAAPAA